MFSLYPRPSASSTDGVVVEEEDDVVSRYRALCGIAVVCVSILLFCVLAATASVWKACTFAATAALLLVVLGCSAPASTWVRRRRGGRPSPVLALTAAARGGGGGSRVRVPPRAPGGCASCAPLVVDAPPAFAYVIGGPPLEGGEQQASSSVMCSVCLEEVRGGEMVRRLPACMHVFHVGCVDMWLRSHRTCPMCRCVVSRTPKAAQPEQAPSPEEEASLPPV